jgi:thioredoxin
MSKPLLLNSSFKILNYTGGKEQDGYEIENVLDINSRAHCSQDGSNFAVSLKYEGKSEKFSLTNFVIRGGDRCTEPLKNALLFVSSSEITTENMEKYKDFTEEQFKTLSKSNEKEPILFIQTDTEHHQFHHEFKPNWIQGKFIGVLFINSHGKQTNIDVQHIGLVGFDGVDEKYYEVGNVSDEFKIMKKTLSEGFNEFHSDHFAYLSNKPNLMLFSKDEKQIQAFKDVAENSEFKGKFSFFGTDENYPGCVGIIDSIGLNIFPCLTLFDARLTFKYVLTKDIGNESILKFCQGFFDKTLVSIVKSAPRPKDDKDPKHPGLTKIVADSFKEIVLNTSKDVFVDVYADWCGPCVAIAPTIALLAESFEKAKIDSIVIGKIDTDANDVDRTYFPETSIPNMKFFPQDSKDKPVKYNGNRTAKDLLKFFHDHAKTKFDIKAVESQIEAVQKLQEARALGKVHKVHDESQFNEAIKTDKLVVVDFTASWCGPCKYIAPKFAEFSNEYENVLFVKLDVDEVSSVPPKYGVNAFPTFKFIKNSKVVDTLEGADPESLEDLIKKHQ